MLAGNIAAARARNRLQQSDLADRMRTLGFRWVRQTVGEVEKGRRRVDIGELYGIALALDLPIATLVLPWADEGEPTVRLPSGLVLEFSLQFKIRSVPWAPILWDGNTLKGPGPVHEHASSLSPFAEPRRDDA